MLIIDYVKDNSVTGKSHKVCMLETGKLTEVLSFNDTQHEKTKSLRIIHVQNSDWARAFFADKFDMDVSEDTPGALLERSNYRERSGHRTRIKGRKSTLQAKASHVYLDQWRSVKSLSFGCDCLRQYAKNWDEVPEEEKPMLELNHYNSSDESMPGFNVFVEPITVYMQLAHQGVDESQKRVPEGPRNRAQFRDFHRMQLQQKIDEYYAENPKFDYEGGARGFDSGNTIVIFSDSASASVTNTLIGAREEQENLWGQLDSELQAETLGSDNVFVTMSTNVVLRSIFEAISSNWDKLAGSCETHVEILEQRSKCSGIDAHSKLTRHLPSL